MKGYCLTQILHFKNVESDWVRSLRVFLNENMKMFKIAYFIFAYYQRLKTKNPLIPTSVFNIDAIVFYIVLMVNHQAHLRNKCPCPKRKIPKKQNTSPKTKSISTKQLYMTVYYAQRKLESLSKTHGH